MSVEKGQIKNSGKQNKERIISFDFEQELFPSLYSEQFLRYSYLSQVQI